MIDLSYVLEVYEAKLRQAQREGDGRTARFYAHLVDKLLKTQEGEDADRS